MHRTTTLTAAGLLGLALLAPAATATTAAATCRGAVATIVGTRDAAVMGTPGDDVIVSDHARSVEAGGGDDLICLTAVEGDPYGLFTTVDAGAGDDVVVSEGERTSTDTDLGLGRDEFHGGGWEDRVEASFDDTIVADRGEDLVNYSIAADGSLPATVGTVTGARGEGWIKVVAPGRRLRIDARAGTLRLDGHVVTTVAVSPRMIFGVAQRVTLLGTPGVDRFGTAACGRSILKGRGGDDEFLSLTDKATPLSECPRRRMTAFGGRGADSIRGTRRDDVLHGGPGRDDIRGFGGRDLAHGGPGRDRCSAEHKKSCER